MIRPQAPGAILLPRLSYPARFSPSLCCCPQGTPFECCPGRRELHFVSCTHVFYFVDSIGHMVWYIGRMFILASSAESQRQRPQQHSLYSPYASPLSKAVLCLRIMKGTPLNARITLKPDTQSTLTTLQPHGEIFQFPISEAQIKVHSKTKYLCACYASLDEFGNLPNIVPKM